MGAKVRHITTEFGGIVILPQSNLAEDATIDVGNTGIVCVLPDSLNAAEVQKLVETVTAAYANFLRLRQSRY